MLADIVINPPLTFRSQDDVNADLWKACATSGGRIEASTIGHSESGRELLGFVAGNGPSKVSLIAGCHSDEPVGPETLRALVVALATDASLEELLSEYTLCIVCQVNPDGEAMNRLWMTEWPDAVEYVANAVRELPGRDVEFAFPDRRPENRAVTAFLAAHAPYALHASLHGMGFSDGALLLIDRRWGFRTDHLQERFRQLAAAAELGLHDHNRRGEKGFFYLGPGFTTTPEGEAMRSYFNASGDAEMASRFGQSSMDYVRSLGGDPLCIVTELPLFVIGVDDDRDSAPGVPATYLEFKQQLGPARAAGDREKIWSLMEDFHVRSLAIEAAVRTQLAVLDAALATVKEDQRHVTV
ncbi:MAG: peptidase M14 [Rhodothermia bacterium]|nr:peptidase M14 [Rhodothermia bacterium]